MTAVANLEHAEHLLAIIVEGSTPSEDCSSCRRGLRALRLLIDGELARQEVSADEPDPEGRG